MGPCGAGRRTMGAGAGWGMGRRMMAASVYVEPLDVKKGISMELEALERSVKVLKDQPGGLGGETQ